MPAAMAGQICKINQKYANPILWRFPTASPPPAGTRIGIFFLIFCGAARLWRWPEKDALEHGGRSGAIDAQAEPVKKRGPYKPRAASVA